MQTSEQQDRLEEAIQGGVMDSRHPHDHRNVLFVAHGTASRASSRLRVFNWLPYLTSQGMTCRVVTQFDDARGTTVLDRLVRRFNSAARVNREVLAHASWADTIVIQEALLPLSLLSRLQRSGKRIVYDFSDPVHLPCPTASRAARLRHRCFDQPRFRRLLEIAHHVLVENAILTKLARPDCPTDVMVGPIDLSRFSSFAPKSPTGCRIGWLGSPGTYSQLEPLLPAIDQLGSQVDGISLHLLGAPHTPSLKHVEVVRHPWSLAGEAQVLSEVDIAVCYLESNSWTRVRGGSKLLAYMAGSCAIVTSPAAIGDQVIEHNVSGLIARTLEDWRDALHRLAADPLLRTRLGQMARRRVEQLHSYEAQLPVLQTAITGRGPRAQRSVAA